MELVLNKNFAEVNLEEINGGVDWDAVVGGTGLVIAAVALTVATGGIGTMAVGAAFAASGSVASLGCVGGAVGGAAIGWGATH